MVNPVSTFSLTDENYYSSEANIAYMSVSQYKDFLKCEARAMAKLRAEYEEPKTTALLVGSYVDSYFEGTLDKFKTANPEIFNSRTGKLKSDFAHADTIIRRIESDRLFMRYMSGKKQVIMTKHLFGCDWKIKMDSYFPDDKIVDLKVMKSMERVMGISFVEHWKYDIQLSIYSEVEGNDLETYIACATKQTEPDIEIIHVPKWRHTECLREVREHMPHILAVKNGEEEPVGCGVCPYCRSQKKLIEPLDFELVGYNTYEKQALKGEFL